MIGWADKQGCNNPSQKCPKKAMMDKMHHRPAQDKTLAQRRAGLGVIFSMFDHSTIAVQPWAHHGYDCYCFDILHNSLSRARHGLGWIYKVPADLNVDGYGWALAASIARLYPQDAHRFMFAWPPCEDMAVSANRHHARKLQSDPRFAINAARRAIRSHAFARSFGFDCIVENPIGRLSTLWRRPDFIWNPYDFGGYLPEGDLHPDYIAGRDAYTKRTGAWVYGNVIAPDPKPVVPEIIVRKTKSGRTLRGSRQFFKLGGSSSKTKQIRNMTPRGAAVAFFLANARGAK